MKNPGPIIVIEDDMDDQELLEETFSILKYPNPVIFFSDGHKAVEYLQQSIVKPVLIISDINMPAIDGFEVRRKILKDEALNSLRIPFVFLTTTSQVNAVKDAHSISYDGFFTKGNTMEEIRMTLRVIVELAGIHTTGQSIAA